MTQPIHPMLERVARAIYDSYQFVKPWEHPDTQRIHHDHIIRAARAAIQALMEPDEGQLAAGRQVACDEQVSGGVVYSTDVEAKAIYRAMLKPLLGDIQDCEWPNEAEWRAGQPVPGVYGPKVTRCTAGDVTLAQPAAKE